jgi:two-component system cell cycle sensor histidine kinase/response regulator CckA
MHTNNDEKLQTILIAAEKASLRAKSLTSQILAFSKSVESMKEESSIVQLLDEFLGFSLQGSNASYEISKPDNPWNCMINKDKIGQAISNIIINAKESMPDGGKITVKVDNATLESNNDISLKKGEYVKITIQDRGIGIAEENLAKVFDPFFSTKSLGSGLGLSVSYSIVNDHNGYMSVESDLGKGTTVCVYLPAVSKQISSRKQKSNVSHSGKKRILVMDDEEMIRDFLAKALRHIGYDIELCQNGEEAIQIYRKAIHENNPFDAVIIDLTIRDGMGGKEAMQKLLEMDPDVKAIVTSGYSSEPILSYYHEYGFMGALPKPFRIKELTELLNKILLKNHQ